MFQSMQGVNIEKSNNDMSVWNMTIYNYTESPYK